MWSITKALCEGFVAGIKWYFRRIKESKWWIPAFIVDMILVPVKIPMIAVACVTKRGRRWVVDTFTEVIEE